MAQARNWCRENDFSLLSFCGHPFCLCVSDSDLDTVAQEQERRVSMAIKIKVV
jgi:hypothetical protein